MIIDINSFKENEILENGSRKQKKFIKDIKESGNNLNNVLFKFDNYLSCYNIMIGLKDALNDDKVAFRKLDDYVKDNYVFYMGVNNNYCICMNL